MATKTNANIGFEKQLWDAACVLWGHIPASDYRKVIIGLIFLRFGLFKLIQEEEALYLYMDKKVIQILGKWQK